MFICVRPQRKSIDELCQCLSKMEPTKLKSWGKETLKKPDWDFSEFSRLPKTAVSRIFLWELDRELGSEKGPFLSEKANHDYYVKCKKSLRQSDV